MNNDLTGIPGLIVKQGNQVEKIQYLTRIDNEKYLRNHPEVEFILESFIVKLLEDRPDNTFEYAGDFFNQTDFQKEYKNYLKENK
jgi:hypothetical protein